MNAARIVNRLLEDGLDDEADLVDEIDSADAAVAASVEEARAAWPAELRDIIHFAPADFILSIHRCEAETDYTPPRKQQKDYPLWPVPGRYGEFTLKRIFPGITLYPGPDDGAPIIAIDVMVGDYTGSKVHAEGSYSWGTPEYEQAKAKYSYAEWYEARAEYFRQCAMIADDPLSLIEQGFPTDELLSQFCVHQATKEAQLARVAQGSVLP